MQGRSCQPSRQISFEKSRQWKLSTNTKKEKFWRACSANFLSATTFSFFRRHPNTQTNLIALCFYFFLSRSFRRQEKFVFLLIRTSVESCHRPVALCLVFLSFQRPTSRLAGIYTLRFFVYQWISARVQIAISGTTSKWRIFCLLVIPRDLSFSVLTPCLFVCLLPPFPRFPPPNGRWCGGLIKRFLSTALSIFFPLQSYFTTGIFLSLFFIVMFSTKTRTKSEISGAFAFRRMENKTERKWSDSNKCLTDSSPTLVRVAFPISLRFWGDFWETWSFVKEINFTNYSEAWAWREKWRADRKAVITRGELPFELRQFTGSQT